jgi:surface antigen
MKFFTLLLVALSLTACAVSPNGGVGPDSRVFNKETVIPLGAGLLSAVVCSKLFRGHGSKAFVVQHNTALENNRIGQTTSWSDPDGSNHTLTPTQTYNDNSRPCRDFRQTVEIGGRTEIMTGKACRQNDGSWKLIG